MYGYDNVNLEMRGIFCVVGLGDKKWLYKYFIYICFYLFVY